MVKGIEKYGVPVVHMATVVPISLTIGANRIIPGVVFRIRWVILLRAKWIPRRSVREWFVVH